RDVIVAEDEFLSSSGDTITLDLTKAELDRQPSFEEADYTLPPVGWVAPLGYGLPADAYLLPVAVAPPPAGGGVAPTIKKGDAVKDRDGDTVGVVREVGFDEKTGDITGFVVMAGGGLERLVGGGQAADIQHEAGVQSVRSERARRYLRVDLVAREVDCDLGHWPVSAVMTIRIAAAATTAARIARRSRGCVRTLTAAPAGDATSAATKTMAAS